MSAKEPQNLAAPSPFHRRPRRMDSGGAPRAHHRGGALEESLAAARLRARSWSTLSSAARRPFLELLRRGLLKRRDTLCWELSRICDRPRYEMLRRELMPSLAKLATRLRNPTPPAHGLALKPGGVVAVVSEGQQPFSGALQLCIDAFSSGCAVLLATPRAPRVARLVTRVLESAGWPLDLSFEVSPTSDVLEQLAAAGVDEVWLRGGRRATRRAWETLTERDLPGILEEERSSLALVTRRAPLARSARAVIHRAFSNLGLTHGAVRRVLASQEIARSFGELLTIEAARLRQGRDDRFDVDMCQSQGGAAQRELSELVEDAVRRGAERLIGSSVSELGSLTPTILQGVTHEMPIAHRDDLRGPVLILEEVPDTAAAILRINREPAAAEVLLYDGSRKRSARIRERLSNRRVVSEPCWLNQLGVAFGPRHDATQHREEPGRPRLGRRTAPPAHELELGAAFDFPYDQLKYRALSELMTSLSKTRSVKGALSLGLTKLRLAQAPPGRALS